MSLYPTCSSMSIVWRKLLCQKESLKISSRNSQDSTKVGVLATGDDVQEWSGVFDELARNYDRKTIALDMEAHAIGAISAFNNIPFIIAKGVGDFAKNGKKFDNRYIEYACKMSCNFIISFFESLDEVELI